MADGFIHGEPPTEGTPVPRTFNNTSAQTAALTDEFYRITANEDCYYLVGTNPTATSSSNQLAAATYLEIRVPAGQKIAVLRRNVDGTFVATPLS